MLLTGGGIRRVWKGLQGRRRGRRALARSLTVLGIGMLAPAWIGAAAAQDVLNSAGATLTPYYNDPGSANIFRVVALNGDVPTATHIVVHLQSTNAYWQRVPQGWLPWDGNVASLQNSGSQQIGPNILFNVVNGNISDWLFPVSVTVAYRTATELKYGTFEVEALP